MKRAIGILRISVTCALSGLQLSCRGDVKTKVRFSQYEETTYTIPAAICAIQPVTPKIRTKADSTARLRANAIPNTIRKRLPSIRTLARVRNVNERFSK